MEVIDLFGINFKILNYNHYIKYVIAIAIIYVSVKFLVYRRRQLVQYNILLMGLRDSGKTLLHTKLTSFKFVKTCTSTKPNIADFQREDDIMRIVDIPGHVRLRTRYFDQHKANTRGIVFVINSSRIAKNLRHVAGYLYVILTDPVLLKNGPKIMILCHKQDEEFAENSFLIKIMLENEMNKIRYTKLQQLESADPNNKNNKIAILGNIDTHFNFNNIPPYSVEFSESYINPSDAKLDLLSLWLLHV